MHITLTPAYGRDYKSAKAVTADWQANKDFAVATVGIGGAYANRNDLVGHIVFIRYSQLTRITKVQ